MSLPILLDQDGVLADFVAGLYYELKQFTSQELYRLLPPMRDLPRFYVDECIDTGNEAHDKLLRTAIQDIVDNRSGLFRRLPKIDGAGFFAKKLAERAAEQGIEVVVCTAPHVENKTCHSDKAAWLEEHFGHRWAKNAIMTHDKTLVQGLVLVDDKPAITGLVEPTWQHIIFDASYNRNAAGARINGWDEHAVEFIIDKAVKMQIARGMRG